MLPKLPAALASAGPSPLTCPAAAKRPLSRKFNPSPTSQPIGSLAISVTPMHELTNVPPSEASVPISSPPSLPLSVPAWTSLNTFAPAPIGPGSDDTISLAGVDDPFRKRVKDVS
jgi:hypothetical protein